MAQCECHSYRSSLLNQGDMAQFKIMVFTHVCCISKVLFGPFFLLSETEFHIWRFANQEEDHFPFRNIAFETLASFTKEIVLKHKLF